MDIITLEPETAKLAVELELADIDEILDGLYATTPVGDQRSGLEALRKTVQN
ncbi:hypothetical protein K469DRAFT_56412 [Zopfia rhizophila CBS 207.26]|uniref:Uncharacterized protein n=1 Tax=Zopfia rhizophila CBS 207.26 TaxID=1314779 RepID=A0A6A6DBK1_9PEZI|nr:hypothetical protein K469DRAFT_56412 [Zopfia rhizophila CBS 207.26]